MSRWLVLTLAVLSVPLGGVAAQQTRQGGTAQTPAAETDPNYVLDAAFLQGAYPENVPGLTLARVIREVKPVYTPRAMRLRIRGTIELRVRVGTDGTVEGVRVLESLDREDLDREAMSAALKHLFTPARFDGAAVPSLVTLTLRFDLG